ncbi:dethiobiotin synthase [Vibrio sp.]|uniref:ATP-dependent dethiobiotin synthetase BioD n=1 Tax=Vibrio viridaestus TaxID=2487322 RepID=A0A3N9TCU7_9VIBR|nr:dethiobiotin synthase [Vibrio viridaestus]MDC0609513.1 dethiobiotin synthase [Vibrio sp.]RQW61991.1 ATP-dependent dethiobiotin synthetase BioD [Vibrio viridaestus]
MINAFFVAGTDTDVGKTVASKAILQALSAKGIKTLGYKPVAAGCEETPEGRRNSDALHLIKASNSEADYVNVNPYTLLLPASPHIAAKHDGVEIDFDVLSDNLAKNKDQADIVLVEGAGGWRVPVSDNEYLSSWVKRENLPVVLVVGIKLGCLNHAKLTAEAILNDGLNIIGWVANRINPGTEHYHEIITMLEHELAVPKLGEIPYVPSAKRSELGKYIDVKPILEA